jgi:hypothetical protein
MNERMMRRRPFLLLFMLMAGSALIQAAFAPARSIAPLSERGDLPPGTVCTACGPISMGVCSVQGPPLDASLLKPFSIVESTNR